MKQAYLAGIASIALALGAPAAAMAEAGAVNGANAVNHTRADNGTTPSRGDAKTASVGGEPLPSQRLTTTGGGVAGSNTALPSQFGGHRMPEGGVGAASSGTGGAAAGGAGTIR